jgi:hypothetical protein
VDVKTVTGKYLYKDFFGKKISESPDIKTNPNLINEGIILHRLPI